MCAAHPIWIAELMHGHAPAAGGCGVLQQLFDKKRP
jgi:hypothetical protein